MLTRSPNIDLFDRFQANWNKIDESKYESSLSIAKVRDSITLLEKIEIVNFIRDQLSMQKHERKDYIEFLQLVLLFLGEKDKFKIKIPGAKHRARFMARAIYSFKILLFRKQFKLTGKRYT